MLARSARYIAHALPQHITSSSFRCFAMSTVSDLTKLEEVVSFWSTVDQRKKFTKDPDFDTLLIEKYSDLHASLMAGAYDSPLELSPMPALLGAVLVLDQFSRNMFRGSSKSFESDAKALALAKQAISQGCLEKAGLSREWFFLPLMHSEDLDDQNMCVEYFTTSPWVSAEPKSIWQSCGVLVTLFVCNRRQCNHYSHDYHFIST